MQEFIQTDKQKEATLMCAQHTNTMLLGGSGSGKTFELLRLILIRAAKAPGTDHLICRQHYSQVRASVWNLTLKLVLRKCFPGIKLVDKVKDGFTILPNGSRLWFLGLDSHNIEKVLGMEFSTIYAGECSQVPWSAILVLQTRLRQVSPLKLRFFYDCNPPSMAHWTYKVFIKGIEPTTGEKKNIADYGYLTMNPVDNADNLPETYLKALQDLPPDQRQRFWEGRFLSDVIGALWTRDLVTRSISYLKSYQELEDEIGIKQVFMGVDPSIEHNEDSDLCGIVVCVQANDDLFYVVDDKSIKASPNGWARQAIATAEEYEVDRIIVETNQGGKMVATILRSNGYIGKIDEVHASRAKHARAQPVVDLYEQGRVKHLDNGRLRDLEEELLCYVPFIAKKSPDRLDALVWAMSYFVGKKDTLKLLETIDWDKLGNISQGKRI